MGARGGNEKAPHGAGSEVLFDSGLLHDSIGCVAGFDLSVNSDGGICDGAEPDVVVAVSVPDKPAAMFLEFIPDFGFILSHKPLPKFEMRLCLAYKRTKALR